jgi:hypothetical protein
MEEPPQQTDEDFWAENDPFGERFATRIPWWIDLVVVLAIGLGLFSAQALTSPFHPLQTLDEGDAKLRLNHIAIFRDPSVWQGKRKSGYCATGLI